MSKNNTRNGAIDSLRFVGAVGIVWFHLSMPGKEIALAALPMFVILLVMYGAGRPVAERATRLLVPWAIWSVIFAVAKFGDAALSGAPLAGEFELWMLVTGTALHLWFLPFSFVFLVLFQKLKGRALWAVSVPASLGAIWVLNRLSYQVPLSQWSSVLPAAFLGLALANTQKTRQLSLGFVAVWVALYMVGWKDGTLQLAVGALATYLAITIRFPSTPLIRALSDISLGIYLIHPLIYALALHTNLPDGLGMFAIVLGFSVLGTMTLKRVMPRAV